MQVYEGDGLQTILALLPTPYDGPSASDAAAAATATAGTGAASAWANKPQSTRLQTRLLQLLAAILQSAIVRSSILSTDSSPSSTVCLSILLNILNPDAPQVAPPVVVTPAAGKAAVGKADGKAKAGGKGKAEAVSPMAAVPPPELLPPFPTAVQLPAVQCLQVSTICANLLPFASPCTGVCIRHTCWTGLHACCLTECIIECGYASCMECLQMHF